MFLLGKLFGGRDNAKVRAIKMLPEVYVDMVGEAGRCRLKHLRAEIGFFELHFSGADGEKYACQMTACVTGIDLVFSTHNRSVLVSSPFTAEKLRPVLELAVAHSPIPLV
ncbi:TPA: hypothetical protein I8374_002224 [Serratia marcescens]|jgi:hypothetical protein|uniref:hypothetical protein n=1 Tax=Serratia TaxID=613 RepID=UPI000666F4E6|nr:MULTISPECIES: hypothetical protein [Serratia]MBH2666221.1 hypothetical protein [Serratia marcescens]MBH2670896.1 hypothetical protein [Serratia marcescens]MBH3055601.1 hypothetical protein [Serratia marcescens]MBH3204395.1 hypothetical protein [Serratia marcescens]MBH3299000.1 hypothetical protein [Serratia marcescens]